MTGVLNHLWQSSAFAGIVALAAWALRRNSPRARYWLWLSASLKFLIPFSWLVSTAAYVTLPPNTPSLRALPVMAISTYFAPVSMRANPVSVRTPLDWAFWLGLLWLGGAIFLVIRRCRQWWTLRRVARGATPVSWVGRIAVLESNAGIEPGIFGLLRPVLLLPEGLVDTISSTQFNAILAHELRHVRCRDNLTAALHMCVESMFWFFPPVWWIGAKLMEERERDCDEAALAQGGCPGEYARSILQVCGRYVGSLLPCAAGISRADLKTRVAKIMTWRKPLPVTLRAKIGLAMAATMAVLVPLGIGMARGQSEQVSAFRVQAVPTLKFDAATIKPTPVDAQGRPLSGNTYSYFRGNRANLSCNVRAAIAAAYNAQPYQVNYPKEDAELMRSWYDIVGVPTGPATAEQLRTMLQALFAERFKLVVQYEMRSTPGYALVVAKGGPKNLNPMQPIDPEHPSASDRGLTIAQLAGRLYLNDQGYWVGPNISGAIPVDDETAIKGSYDLWPGPFGHAGFSPAAAPPQEEIGNDRESLADLLNEKLGLTLVKKTVSRAYITVRHIAPPSPN